mmetsp:Transcript_11215/g.24057  ORF Transcript_11215/g.24057 Transcript_11215/m.24057 type:complete len:117 (+) Transcript_11215:1174-1524(+)
MMPANLCPLWASMIVFRLVQWYMCLPDIAHANAHDFECGHVLHDDEVSMCGYDRAHENGFVRGGHLHDKFRSGESHLEFLLNQNCSESGSLPVPSSYQESSTRSSNLYPKNCRECR